MRVQTITLKRARALRRALTPPEARLWVFLSRRRLGGHHFRKQHAVGPFIVDFYCSKARLAVEIDGAGHDLPDQMARDARRTAWLEGQGVRVVRFAAADVMRDCEVVLQGILSAVADRMHELHPPPR